MAVDRVCGMMLGMGIFYVAGVLVLAYGVWAALWLRNRQARKLAKGQCQTCRKPLRDDETSGFCSTECGEEMIHATAW